MGATEQQELPECICDDCGWTGDSFDVAMYSGCPDCGSDEVYDYEDDGKQQEGQ